MLSSQLPEKWGPVLHKYRQDWQADRCQPFRRYLEEVSEKEQDALLLALVELDIELRRAADLPLSKERYEHLGSPVVARLQSFIGASGDTEKPTTRLKSTKRHEPSLTDDDDQQSPASPGEAPEDLASSADSTIRKVAASEDSHVSTGVTPEALLLARFRIKAELGSGAFGTVYRAWDEKAQRDVALKMPAAVPGSHDLLQREAQAASRLRDPHIVRLFDVVEADNTLFIVSEYIEGQSLAALLRNQPAGLGIEESCRFIVKVAKAIQHAHDSHVIHRDLKPGNILVDAVGEPYVLDFGLARSLYWQKGSIAGQGSPFGTPAYMPPEQARGDEEAIDHRADVYSLGVVLYELCTRTLPFQGETQEVIEQVKYATPIAPRDRDPNLPRALDAIILKAMEKQPSERYASAHELAVDLEHFLEGKRVKAYDRIDGRVARRYAMRYGLSTVVLVLLLTLFGLVVSFIINPPAGTSGPEKRVSIETSVSDATLTWTRLDPQTGEAVEEVVFSQSGDEVSLLPGVYRVVAEKDGFRHEVFRTVPEDNSVVYANPVVPLKHRSWDEQDGVIILPDIELVAPNPPDDAILVSGGEMSVSDSPGTSLFLKGRERKLAPFFITERELTLADVEQKFEGILAISSASDSVSFDIAVAYAEEAGASIPTIYEYMWVEEQGVALPGLRDGLQEWTSTPMLSGETGMGQTTTIQPGDLDQRLLLKSEDHSPRIDLKSLPLSNKMWISPAPQERKQENTGFRLVWRVAP